MTNEKRLYTTNLYDLLCRIQENIHGCIIESILGIEERPCPAEFEADKGCNRCIAAWMSEEAEW